MIKISRKFLTMGLISAVVIAAPVALVVSCGTTYNKHEIKKDADNAVLSYVTKWEGWHWVKSLDADYRTLESELTSLQTKINETDDNDKLGEYKGQLAEVSRKLMDLDKKLSTELRMKWDDSISTKTGALDLVDKMELESQKSVLSGIKLFDNIADTSKILDINFGQYSGTLADFTPINKLETLIAPKVTNISHNAFGELKSLKTLELDMVKNIEESAFGKVKGLDSFDLHTIEYLGKDAFAQNTFKTINIVEAKTMPIKMSALGILEDGLKLNINSFNGHTYTTDELKAMFTPNSTKVEHNIVFNMNDFKL